MNDLARNLADVRLSGLQGGRKVKIAPRQVLAEPSPAFRPAGRDGSLPSPKKGRQNWQCHPDQAVSKGQR